MSPLLSCLAAITWGIMSVVSCFKVSLILLRNSSGFFRRSSAVDSGLPNLTMISLSLLPVMMEVGGVGGYIGVLPDLTLSAQVAILPEGCIVLLTAFLMRVISSAIDDFARWWIWLSLSRMSCGDGCSLVFSAYVLTLLTSDSKSWSGSFWRCPLSRASNAVAFAKMPSLWPPDPIGHNFRVLDGSQKPGQWDDPSLSLFLSA
jgi:hypothetical protein